MLYIRPMYSAHDPHSTRRWLCIYEAPMRPPERLLDYAGAVSAATLETMPVDAKAGCLYPNYARPFLCTRPRVR